MSVFYKNVFRLHAIASCRQNKYKYIAYQVCVTIHILSTPNNSSLI